MDFFKPLGEYIQAPQQKTPEQQQQEALIEALRGMGAQSAAAPAQTGAVVNANAPAGSMGQAVDLGMGLGQLGNKLNNKFNFGTALQYGTTPGSQQTSMLAAQDMGF